MGDRTLTKVVDGGAHAGVADTVAAPGEPAGGGGDDGAMFRELGAGDFQLRDEVARGGMGRVIRAFDRRLQRVVALKLLVDDSPARRARFAREARITAQLQHPSIVPVYDAGSLDNGDLAYAMKLVSGRELGAAIAAAHDLAERLPLLPRIVDVADAIAYAHAHRVIHRDLKPSNVILGEFGETIVIDWGIAKELDAAAPTDGTTGATGDRAELTHAGSIVGTPAYMAPEQALGADRLDDRADVYAIGAILYELLAGQRPYDAPDSTSMLARIVAGPPPALETVEPGVPRALAAIVRRAMAREPADRYTARELAAELRRFTSGQLVAAHRYSVRERLVRWLRRRKEAVAVAAIALAVLAVGAVGSATRIIRERDAAEDARAREAARADDLLVARAATLAATDPIAAVGLLHELPAASASWRAARDVLAAARARGVPWVFAAARETRALVIARDGSVAYAAGDDGVVRRLDLVRHRESIVRRVDHVTALALVRDDTELVIATSDGALAMPEVAPQPFDPGPPTGAAQEVEVALKLASPVARLVARGATIAWIDAAGDVWTLDRASPHRIAAGVHASALALGSDGRFAATVEAGEVALYDLIAPAGAPALARRPVAAAAALAWSQTGHRLAIASSAELVEVDVDRDPQAARAIRAGVATAPVYAGGDLYFKSAQDVLRDGDGVVDQVAIQPDMTSFAGATRDDAVYATLTGAITVVGRGGVATIRAPVPRLWSGAAAAAGTTLVVAAAGHVLAYDAADVVARPLDTRDGAVAGELSFAGDDAVVDLNAVGESRLFDVATGSASSLGRLGLVARPLGARDGSYVLALGSRDLVVARPGQPAALLGAVTEIAATPDHFAVADGDQLVDVALPDLRRRVAWSAGDLIVCAAATPSHVAAATATTLWRDGETIAAGSDRPWSLALAHDGTLYVASSATIYRWDPGARELAWHAALGSPIAELWATDAARPVVARDADGALWTIARAGMPPTRALPDGVAIASVADDAPLAAGVVDGELRAYDLETHQAWRLGAAGLGVAMSPSGRRVVTRRDGRAAIATLALPDTVDDYARALDAITNLRIGDTPDHLIWPPPDAALTDP
nr:serine/threonine-protein kinase [Kofleriaceae bacterium]